MKKLEKRTRGVVGDRTRGPFDLINYKGFSGVKEIRSDTEGLGGDRSSGKRRRIPQNMRRR